MENLPPRPCVQLSDVVDPDEFRRQTMAEDPLTFLTAISSVDSACLGDDQLLAAQLDAPDLTRARQILVQSGGLNPLTRMGLADHRNQGLSPTESARLLLLPGMAARLLDRRTETKRLSTAKDLVDEIATRSLGWEGERFGIVGIDHRGIRTVDKTLYVGTANSSYLHPREIMREALRMDVVWMVAWFYQPYSDPMVDQSTRSLIQEIRMLGDVSGAKLWDALIIAEGEAISIRTQEGWVD